MYMHVCVEIVCMFSRFCLCIKTNKTHNFRILSQVNELNTTMEKKLNYT